MNLPPFFYSKAFWQAVSLIVATLVVYFFPDAALTAAMVEAVIFALLQLIGVTPELRAKGFRGWTKRQ